MPYLKKSSFLRISAIFLIGILLASCASTGPKVTQEELRRKEEEFQRKFFEASESWMPRIYRVGYRLLSSHVPGHGKSDPKFNFIGVGVDELKQHGRKIYGVRKSVKGVLVRGLYPGSKAEGLDIQTGDIITRVDGKKVKNLGSYFKGIRKTKRDTVRLGILRKTETLEREVPVERVYYNAQFFLAPTPHFDASALFSKIDVGIGAIRYCRNDDELAVIMGHELGHTTLKHSMKKLGAVTATGVLYGVIGGLINIVTFPGLGSAIVYPMAAATDAFVSRRYEREADYFGMQHAFHAGYDVGGGAKVFSRLATDAPGFELLAYTFSTHPKSPERFLRLEKIAGELKQKYPEKLPLLQSPDWEVVVPVRPGESVEEALETLLREKEVKTSETDTASPASPDTPPAFAYPEPST